MEENSSPLQGSQENIPTKVEVDPGPRRSKRSAKGIDYQIEIASLFVISALKQEGIKYNLVMDTLALAKFDDVVIDVHGQGKRVRWFIQAKHREGDAKITLANLFAVKSKKEVKDTDKGRMNPGMEGVERESEEGVRGREEYQRREEKQVREGGERGWEEGDEQEKKKMKEQEKKMKPQDKIKKKKNAQQRKEEKQETEGERGGKEGDEQEKKKKKEQEEKKKPQDKRKKNMNAQQRREEEQEREEGERGWEEGDEKEKKKNAQQKEINTNFSLVKYFQSFLDIRNELGEKGGTIERYVIYTTATLENELTGKETSQNENNNASFKRVTEEYDLLDINKSVFQLQLNESMKERLLSSYLTEKYTVQDVTDIIKNDVRNKIRDFLQDCRFAVGQPNIRKLYDILQDKAKEVNVSLDPTDLRNAICEGVNKWYMSALPKPKESKYFTQEDVKPILLTVPFITYEKSVTLDNATFTDSSNLDSSITNNKCVLCISTTSIKLCYNRLIQSKICCFKHPVLDFETLKRNKYLDMSYFPTSECETLIIVFENTDHIDEDVEILESLISIFIPDCSANDQSYARSDTATNKLKLVLISPNLHLENILKKKKPKFQEEINYLEDEIYSFDSLSDTTQSLIKRKKIIFQGTVVTWNELCSENSMPSFTPTAIEKLISESCIEVGKKVTSVKEELSKFIPRKLHTKMILLLKLCLLDLSEHEFVFVESLNEEMRKRLNDKITELSSELQNKIRIHDAQKAGEEFEELRILYPTRNIHMLKVLEHDMENITLQLFRTCGSYDNLRHIAHEIDISTDSNVEFEQLAVLTSESGMGKTILISHIAEEEKKKSKDKWVFYVRLKDVASKLINIEPNDEFQKFAKCVGAILAEEELDKVFLQHCIEKTGKFVLLLDGYDEIESEQRTKVRGLVMKLMSDSPGQVIITTKLHFQEELENTTSTFAYRIEPLTTEQQEELLEATWIRNLGLSSKEEKSNVKEYVKYLLKCFSESTDKRFESLIGIPLQLKILGEVYKESCDKYCNADAAMNNVPDIGIKDILELYKSFEEKKCLIFTEEILKENSGSIGEKIQKTILHNHRNESTKISLEELLPSSEIACNCCMKVKPLELPLLDKEHLIKIGVLQRMGLTRMTFIHETFAVYFFASHIGNLFTKNISCDKFINVMRENFYGNDYSLVRMFVNIDLSSKRNIHSATLSKNIDDLKSALQNSTAIDEADDLGRTACHLAAGHGHAEAIQLLLEKRCNVETRDKLQFTPVDIAIKLENWEVCMLFLSNQVKFKLDEKNASTFLEYLFKELSLEDILKGHRFSSTDSSECLYIRDWILKVVAEDHLQLLLDQIQVHSSHTESKENITKILEICIHLIIEKVIKGKLFNEILKIKPLIGENAIADVFTRLLESWVNIENFPREAVLLATLLNSEKFLEKVFKKVETSYILQESETGMTLIEVAVHFWLEKSLRFLLKKLSEEDIPQVLKENLMQENRIHLAASSGNSALLQSYIQLISDNNGVVSDYLSHKDSSGRTPLHEAAINNHAAILQLVILKMTVSRDTLISFVMEQDNFEKTCLDYLSERHSDHNCCCEEQLNNMCCLQWMKQVLKET